MAARRTKSVSEEDQIRMLQHPVRQEIVDTVMAIGRCSLREVAEHLGRPADGLYYHARALVDAGLLVQDGERATSRRPEALYRAPVDGIMRIRYRPENQSHSEAVRGVVGSMLKTAAGDFAKGLHPDLAVCAGPERNLHASRQKAWLSREERREVNRLFAELQRLFASTSYSEGDELWSVTFVAAPIEYSHARRGS